jgi:hypothetical protein
VRAEGADKGERTLRILVDTGAEVNLLRPGVFDDSLWEKAHQPLHLITVSGDGLQGGQRVARLKLRLQQSDGVVKWLSGTFYEAAVEYDAILGYKFLTDHNLAIYPSGRCLMSHLDAGWQCLGEGHPVKSRQRAGEKGDKNQRLVKTSPEKDQDRCAVRAVRQWDTQDYAVRSDLVTDIVTRLGAGTPSVDAFASPANARFKRFWTADQDAFKQRWDTEQLLWINPPFDRLQHVVKKIRDDEALAIVIVPRWTSEPWWSELNSMALDSYTLPKGPIFLKEGKTELPMPRWRVVAFLLYGALQSVQLEESMAENLHMGYRKSGANVLSEHEAEAVNRTYDMCGVPVASVVGEMRLKKCGVVIVSVVGAEKLDCSSR